MIHPNLLNLTQISNNPIQRNVRNATNQFQMRSLKSFNEMDHKLSTEHQHRRLVDNTKYYNTDQNLGPPLPVVKWVDKDLMLCVHPRCANYIHTTFDKQVAIPMNTVFDFESKIFSGKAIVRCIGLTSTDNQYFNGRTRKMDITIQVR